MVVSLLGHTACVATYAVLAGQRPPPVKLEDNIVKARLVKLGKKRDEKLLPRLDKAPPPPAVPKKAAPKDAPKPPEKAKATPKLDAPRPKRASASDILNRFREDNDRPDLDSLIQKAVGAKSDEGHEEGNKLGSEITGRLKAEYNDVLVEKIRSLYELPDTISDEERVRLEGFLYLRIGPEGQLADAKVDKTSGNAAFDGAMVAAAKKAAPFPPPPIPLRPFYGSGVVFRFRP